VDGDLVEPQEAYLKATDKVGIVNMLKQRNKDVSFVDAVEVTAGTAGTENGTKPAARPAGR
jgi:hypothetical protein